MSKSPQTPAAAAAKVRMKSVFVNCPYDDGWLSHLDALIFAVVCCGFQPRSAVDGVGSHPRMTRIATALCDSQLSIHDLSRWKGEEPQYLARMNMPFELGMAVEMQRAHAVSQSNMAHEWLVLAPQATPLDHVLSDLKAYDHELYQDRSDMVRKVVNWLLKWRHDLRLPRLRVPADRVADALATLDQLLLQQRPMGQHAREAWGTTVSVAQQHARSVLP